MRRRRDREAQRRSSQQQRDARGLRHVEADSQHHQEGVLRQDPQDDGRERGERHGRLRVINYIYYE